jgi:ubiquinone/menaquinone biosynthesis C-methylase UbiE
MDSRLQHRVQRYGWDLAATAYEPLWQDQLAAVQSALLARAALKLGERVLDVACGTGLVTLPAARAVGSGGLAHGVDISERMVEALRTRAVAGKLRQVAATRMDAQHLLLPDAGFDVVLCALGLMYVHDPAQALCEVRRVLRPGGRALLAVWGARTHCGWAPLFEIVDAEVRSEVCPMFFGLGQPGALAQLGRHAGLSVIDEKRLTTTLDYANGEQACEAAFAGGPVALAWQRFDAAARERVCARYLEAIAPWCDGAGYRIPAEYVVVELLAPLPS